MSLMKRIIVCSLYSCLLSLGSIAMKKEETNPSGDNSLEMVDATIDEGQVFLERINYYTAHDQGKELFALIISWFGMDKIYASSDQAIDFTWTLEILYDEL